MKRTEAIGTGIVAGAVGTAAMTIVQWGYGTSWDAEEVAIYALHHVVYAGTTSAACDRLSGLGPR